MTVRLEITRRSDLAVRALAILASSPGRMKGSQLAFSLGTTVGFLPQVLLPLVERGWVRSSPGPAGGYLAEVSLDEVTVLEVIEAVEGPTNTGRCVLWDGPCAGDELCALHVPWSRARGQLLELLGATKLSEV